MDLREFDLTDSLLEGIFPVTIVKDTHDGAFCGGKYIAWFKEPNEVPSGSRSDPIEAKLFWRTYKSDAEIRNKVGICGIGNTIDAACRNLKLTLSDLGYFKSDFFTDEDIIEDDDLENPSEVEDYVDMEDPDNSRFFEDDEEDDVDDLGPLDDLRLYEGERDDEDDYPF